MLLRNRNAVTHGVPGFGPRWRHNRNGARRGRAAAGETYTAIDRSRRRTA